MDFVQQTLPEREITTQQRARTAPGVSAEPPGHPQVPPLRAEPLQLAQPGLIYGLVSVSDACNEIIYSI